MLPDLDKVELRELEGFKHLQPASGRWCSTSTVEAPSRGAEDTRNAHPRNRRHEALAHDRGAASPADRAGWHGTHRGRSGYRRRASAPGHPRPGRLGGVSATPAPRSWLGAASARGIPTNGGAAPRRARGIGGILRAAGDGAGRWPSALLRCCLLLHAQRRHLRPRSRRRCLLRPYTPLPACLYRQRRSRPHWH
jgi:hypothetical protein